MPFQLLVLARGRWSSASRGAGESNRPRPKPQSEIIRESEANHLDRRVIFGRVDLRFLLPAAAARLFAHGAIRPWVEVLAVQPVHSR
jgi:hypothetical protein